MKNITFNQTILATALSSVILSLTACSSGNSGDSGSHSQIQMSGAVVDDFLAYSRIYVDVNNNGKFDPSFEPYAFTDGQGYFTKSATGEDYCADPRAPKYKFCLNIDQTMTKNAVIRASEGRDLLTALTYDSSLSLLTDGNTSNLVLTALSSLNQIQDQIQNIPLPSDLNGTFEGKDMQAFLTSILQNGNAPRDASAPSLTPNTANPLTTDNMNLFRIAINTHKVAETLATFLQQTDRSFTSHNFLGRSNGESLSQQDIIPFVYMALFLNLDFSEGNNTLGTIDYAKTSAILEDAEKLLNTVSNAQSTINTNAVVSTLQSLYSFLTGLQPQTQDYRQMLTQAELVTQTVRQNIEQNPNTVSGQTVEDIRPLITQQVVQNYQNIDFDSAIEQAQNGETISATGIDFSPILNRLLSNYYINLTNNRTNEDKFKIYFKELTQREDSEREGRITICQKQTDGSVNLFKGSWSWSQRKPFAIIGQYLDTAVTIKNLLPEACQTSTGTCVKIDYPDISNESNAIKTQTFSDPTINWNDPAQIPESNLIQPLNENQFIPEQAEQCEF